MITTYLNLLFTSSASLALVGVLIAELRLLTIFLGTEFLDIFFVLFKFVLLCFFWFSFSLTKYDTNCG